MLVAAELAYTRQSEFMGVVAHELRGPLGPIGHAAALLGLAKSEDAVVPIVKSVLERQVTQMSRLVSDLLDMTRINKGKLRMDVQRMDLAQTVRDAIESLRPAIEARLQ